MPSSVTRGSAPTLIVVVRIVMPPSSSLSSSSFWTNVHLVNLGCKNKIGKISESLYLPNWMGTSVIA